MDQYYINATTLDTSVITGDAINWTESMTPVTANIYKIIKTNILGYNDWRYGENFALIFILGW